MGDQASKRKSSRKVQGSRKPNDADAIEFRSVVRGWFCTGGRGYRNHFNFSSTPNPLPKDADTKQNTASHDLTAT